MIVASINYGRYYSIPTPFYLCEDNNGPRMSETMLCKFLIINILLADFSTGWHVFFRYHKGQFAFLIFRA